MAAFWLTLHVQGATRILFVRSEAAAGGDGSSWSTAFSSLQSALGTANPTEENPVEIWIKTGVYKPTTGSDRSSAFVAKSYLTLRGGFAGTESTPEQRVAAASATRYTILSGDIGNLQPDAISDTSPLNAPASLGFDTSNPRAQDNCYNVIRADGIRSFVLDRIALAGGYANASDVSDVTIESMFQPSTDTGGGFRAGLDSRVTGGALYSRNSTVKLQDSWFVGNFASGIGGAVVARGGSLSLTGNGFSHNASGYAGGGVCASGTTLGALNSNIFYGNTSAMLGGALFIQQDTDSTYLKGYIGTALNSIAIIATGDALPDVPASGTSSSISTDVRKILKSTATVASRIYKVSTKSTNLLNLSNAGSTTLTRLNSARLSYAYAAVCLTVSIGDFAVQIALLLGGDPDDPAIQGWMTFSDSFSKYATPTGLAKFAYDSIYSGLIPSPSFDIRAGELRNRDYRDNQNPSELLTASGNRFERNHTVGFGGAVALVRANLRLDRSYFINNEADYGGGAVACFGYNTVELQNSALIGNRSAYGHSALSVGYRSVVRVFNDTLVENHSDSEAGYAIGVDAGGDVSISNSILWGNTNGVLNNPDNINREGGADLYATRKADLEEAGLSAYNDAGDSHGLFTGVIDIQYSIIQSLDRLPIGDAGYPHASDTDNLFKQALRLGYLLDYDYPNIGEGIAPVVGRSNLAQNPMLLQSIYPHPRSPAIDAGTRDTVAYSSTSYWALNDVKRILTTVDIGAIESNGTYPNGTKLYVNGSVAASGDGLSWATAYKTLPEALAQPLAPGDEIWVARNTYTVSSANNPADTMRLAPGVSLIGGFAAGATSLDESDPVANPTIISGEIGTIGIADNSRTLIDGNYTLSDAAHTDKNSGLPRVIRGFHFTRATTVDGAVQLGVPAVVQSCTFDSITGGRALVFSDPALLNNTAKAQVLDSTFEANSGGAIAAYVYNLDVIRSQFYTNSAASAGALYKTSGYGGLLFLERNVFYGNVATAGRGGAVVLEGWNLVAAHNVFVDNIARPTAADTSLDGGAGLWWRGRAYQATTYLDRIEMVNNIFYGNRIEGDLASLTPLEFQQCSIPSIPTTTDLVPVIASNDIEGLRTLALLRGSTGNVDFDPFFVSAAQHNFTLSNDSLLINRGVDYGSISDEGTVITNQRDIGVAESTSTDLRELATLTLTTNKPTELGRTFTLNSPDIGSGATNIVWEVMTPNAIGFVPVTADAWHAGLGTATLTVTNLPHTLSGSIYRVRFTQTLATYTNQVTLATPPAILFVTPDGSGQGISWSAPCSLAQALTLAQPYTQIWMLEGTYAVASTYLTPGVRIYGGFVGTETVAAQRPQTGHPTVLNFRAATTFELGATATWPADGSVIHSRFDSLTVTGASATTFPLRLRAGDVTINRCRFLNLPAGGLSIYTGRAAVTDSTFTDCSGSAITAAETTLSLVGTTFSENTGYQGIVILSGTNATIADCLFQNSSGCAVKTSSGANNQSGNLDIQRSRFIGNFGGAILSQSGPLRVANSLFVRNGSTIPGGAIVLYSGSGTVVHSTFVENSSANAGGAIAAFSSVQLINSIVWNNSSRIEGALYGDITVTNSHVQDRSDSAFYPLFDSTSADYALNPHSPLLNRGGLDATVSGDLDLAALPRRYAGASADLGASEFQGAPSTPVYLAQVPTNLTTAIGGTATFSIALADTSAVANFVWEYLDAGTWRPLSASPGWVIASAGSGSSATFANVSLALNGLQVRVSLPGTLPLATVTLSIVPRTILRVDSRVTTSGDGSSWASAYKTIAAAVAAVGIDSDIWIAGGDYTATSFTPGSTTRFYVGFTGTETSVDARNEAANPVRLVGTASHLTLTPDASFKLPTIAFKVATPPASLTRYAGRSASFSATASTTGTTFEWQFLDGATWRSISQLSGWAATASGTTSTLACDFLTASQQGLQFRALVTGTTETTFPATLTVLPRKPLFVRSNAPAGGDGLSWATAFSSISAALAVANEGSDLWIAGGVYNEPALPQVVGALLYAGFAGNETNLAARNVAANPVIIVGSSSRLSMTDSALASPAYALGGSLTSRAYYLGQPGSLSIALTGAGTGIQWQYLNGTTWSPLDGLAGWTISTSGLTSKAVNLAMPATADGLQIRVAIPATGETSATATLSVKERTRYHVNGAVSASGNGSSWSKAFRTVSEAIALADDGTDIWIAAGTYTEPTLVVPSGTQLHGGFAGTEASLAARTSGPTTTLRNASQARVLTLDLLAAEFDRLTWVEGVTVSGGSATEPAVFLRGRTITLENALFNALAVAVRVENAATSVRLTGCTFSASARDLVVADAGDVDISGCRFTGTTVAAITANVPVDVSDSTFSTAALALDLSATGSGSTITRSVFNQCVDAIRSPAGLIVSDSTFSGNARGLVLTANGTAVTHLGNSRFSTHTTAAIVSTGGLDVSASTFTENKVALVSVAGLTLANSAFNRDAVGLQLADGTATTTLSSSTFDGITNTAITSTIALQGDHLTFNNCALGVSLAGSTASTFVETTFTGGVSGLAVNASARAEVFDSTFTGLSGNALTVSDGPAPSSVYKLRVVHSTFTGITGAVLAQTDSTVAFDRCRVTNNVTSGPAITSSGSLGLFNSLVAQNTSAHGATIHSTGYLAILSCTIADNQSGGSKAAVSGPGAVQGATIRQSILWGNRITRSSVSTELMQAESNSDISYSVVEGLRTVTPWLVADAKNTSFDPLFVDARAGDYRLLPTSPAIDIGGTVLASNLYDLTGAARVQSSAVDPGAYESPYVRATTPVLMNFVSTPVTLVTGDAATYTASYSLSSGYTFRWQVNTGSGWQDVTSATGVTITSTSGGSTLSVDVTLSSSGTQYRAVVSANGTDVYTSPGSTLTVISRPIVYVDASATGARTGATWTDAYTDLASALSAAPAYSDILVAAGTYRAPAGGSLSLRRNQHLTGGHLRGTTTRDPAAYPTILSSALGDPTSSVILTGNADQGALDSGTSIDGFTFRNGGAGLVLTSASVSVSACRFDTLLSGVRLTAGELIVNDSLFTGLTQTAISVIGSGSSLNVAGSTFTGNGGGAITSPVTAAGASGAQFISITDCVFSGNTGTSGGAIGITSVGTSLDIVGSEFIGNSATESGGAVYANSNSSVTIRQSLFAGNSAANGGALYNSGKSLLLFTTIAGNRTTNTASAAIDANQTLTLRDSIVWGNTIGSASPTQLSQLVLRGAANTLADSIIQGLSTLTGERLMPFDPLFIDSAAGNYRLAPKSPAIAAARAGDASFGEVDVAGVLLPSLTLPDLGAYQSAASPDPLYTVDLPATLSGYLAGSIERSVAIPTGFSAVWEYLDGSTWTAFPVLGTGQSTQFGANTGYLTSTTDTKLYFRDLTLAYSGMSIRVRLISGDRSYPSTAVSVQVLDYETIYVDASRTTSGDGRTWAGAYKTLDEGIAAISTARRILYVAAGTYRGPFTLPMRVEVYGGFPAGGGDLASRSASANPTILTGLPATDGGTRAASVVQFTNTGSTVQPVLDGFIVENGQTGLLAPSGVSPTLRRLTVRGHTATGIVLRGSDALIEDSVIENNVGDTGGGLQANASATLTRVILRGNQARVGGGAWMLYGALNSVTVTGNASTTTGGGLFLNSGAVVNSLIAGNTAATGGGLWARYSTSVRQSTIAGNRADTGSALYLENQQTSLRNTIVWGNRTSLDSPIGQLAQGISAGFIVDHSTVEQSTLSGALTVDPLFVAPVSAASAPSSSGNYHTRASSPVLNAGDDSAASDLSVDLDGNPRLYGTVDLGAWEFQGAPVATFQITTQPVALVFDRSAAANRFTVSATNAVSYVWQYASPTGSWTNIGNLAGFSGATSATLTVADDPSLNGYRFRVLITGTDGSVITSSESVLTIAPGNYFVNGSRAGTDAGDGRSWATAFRSIDIALASIPDSPSLADIWIAAGTYATDSTFSVRAGLSLYGGFNGTETRFADRDPAVNITALVGSQTSSAIVTIRATPVLAFPARFDGLTIKDTAGDGIVDSVSLPLVVERVRFTGIVGIAVSAYRSAVEIRSCEFRGNGSSTSNRVPLSISGGTALIENSLFAGNINTSNGAASINTAAVIRNVTIAGNVANWALYIGDPGARVYNSIIWGNRRSNGVVATAYYDAGSFTTGNNVVETGPTYVPVFPSAGSLGNIATDPAFVSPISATVANLPTASGDYHLRLGSSALDAGSNDYLPDATLDLSNASRSNGLFIDAGAYEVQGDLSYALATQPTDQVALSGSATFTVATLYSRPATYVWEESSDDGATYSAVSGGTSATLSVIASSAVHQHLFRVRVQFTHGPLLVSQAARLSTLAVSATALQPAGYSSPARFRATASFAPASWQWQVSTNGSLYVDVPAATSAELAVTGDASFNGSTYRVVATYPEGTVLTSNAVAFVFTDLSASLALASTPSSGIALNVAGGVLASSVNDASLFVHGAFSGRLLLSDFSAPVFTTNGVSLAFNPTPHAGEQLRITTTAGLLRADGVGLRPYIREVRLPVDSGPGIFAAPTPLATTAAATAFALADLDGNGTIDALVANADGLRTAFNSGAGTFSLSPAAFGPAGATAFALGSTTPTGAIDAVVVTSDGNVQIWRNQGAGTFTLAQTITSLTAHAAALGDLDADGDLDLAVATDTGVVLLTNDGAGSFSPARTLGNKSGTALALGDLDLDGDLDLVVTGSGGTSVWLNDGAGGYSSGYTTSTSATRVALADVNADGLSDVVLTRSDIPATLWQNLGNGAFTTLAIYPGGGASTLAAGDLDGDGRADLVLTGSDQATGAWLSSTALSFTRVAGQSPFTLLSAELADLDGDGTLDLFGLDATGIPASALYRVIYTAGDEDTSFTLAAAGFHPTPATIYIRSLPAFGTLLNAGSPVVVGQSFTLAAASTLTYVPIADTHGIDAFTWSSTPTGSTAIHRILVRSVTDSVVAFNDEISLIDGGTASQLLSGATSVLANDQNPDGGAFTATLARAPLRGTLTLNADGTFRYVHDNAGAGTDSFTYIATNVLTGRSDVGTVTITVLRKNTAPDTLQLTPSSNIRYAGQEAGLVVGSVSAYDPDSADAGQLTYTLVAGDGSTHNAEFVLSGNSLKTAISIQSGAGMVRSIRIRATDTLGSFVESAFTLTFVAPPTAGPASVTTPEDTPLTITLPGAGGATALTYQLAEFPSHGSLSVPSGSTAGNVVIYTPNANYHGTDAFTYRTYDSTLTSSVAVVSVTVVPVADAPVLSAPTALSTPEDVPVVFNLTGTDGDGDALTYRLVGSPTLGSVLISGASVTYTPNLNANGTETLTFVADDSGSTSNSAQVVITLVPVNDQPSIAPIAARTLTRNVADSFTAALIDVDGDSLVLRVGVAPQHGVVSITGAAVTYTPAAGYSGADSYTLIASDGSLDSVPATVSLTINNLAAEPVSLGVYRGLYEYTDIPTSSSGDWTGVLPGNVSTPAHGTVTLVENRLRYDHDGSSAATDSFTYTLTNAVDTIRTVSVSITIRDRIIIASSSADSGANTLRDGIATVNRFAGDTLAPAHTIAPDWTIQIQAGTSPHWDSTTYSRESGAEGYYSNYVIRGKVSIDASASPGFVLSQQAGQSIRHFKVAAGASLTLRNLTLEGGSAYGSPDYNARGGAVFNQGTFIAELVVFSSNQASIGTAVYNDGGSVTLTDCLTYNQSLITWLTPTGGIVATRNGSLSILNTVFPDSVSPALYALSTGNGVVTTVNVFDSNLPSLQFVEASGGKIVSNLSYARADTVATTLGRIRQIPVATLLANDLPAVGTILSIAEISPATALGGTVTLADGVITYTPPASATSDDDTFTYTLAGVAGTPRTATVTLRPTAAPQATNDSVARDANGDARITAASLLSNDTAATGATLTLTAVSPLSSQGASVTLASNVVTYTHPASPVVGDDTFTYTITDSVGATATATVTVTPYVARGVPKAVDDIVYRNPNYDLVEIPVAALLANDTESLGGALHIVSIPAMSTYGTMIELGDGIINYYTEPNKGFQDSFTYTIANADGLTATATVSLTLRNQAPHFDVVYNQDVPMNAGEQEVYLGDIWGDDYLWQSVTITAVSSNPSVIPQPYIVSNGGTSYILRYQPTSGARGSSTITVTVKDDGGTAGGGVDTTIQSFTVTVYGPNLAPTIDAITDPAAILEDADTQTLTLGGISAGAGENQNVAVSAVSSNPALIQNPTVTYTSPGATAVLSYKPVANASGTATITVTVADDGGTEGFGEPQDDGFGNISGVVYGVDRTTRTFVVTVLPVNDRPTLDAIADPASINQDAPAQTVALSGLSAGGGEAQSLTVTATSSNPSLIPAPTINYANPAAIGTLTYTPVAGASGTAVITVRVQDDGGTTNGGIDATSRSFQVTILAVDQTVPSLRVAPRSAGGVVLTLAGAVSTRYRIEVSANLTDWTLLDTVETNTSGSGTYQDATVPSTGAARFYRIVRSN